ncbi:stem-specific protein TSJT1-like [Iris pallida]|uniref:Stem-specific protein TSJT1-like n=1 Tax=Iris pallida TaxID=29817 RepID=A0AAX6F814_IRIPA|nr:stem-specific protein TSJT1-like [Iris pallida]
MLAIFHKAFAHPPEELRSPTAVDESRAPKRPEEIMKAFNSLHRPPDRSFSANFSGGAALASCSDARPASFHHRRLFCSFDEIFCMFVGVIDNLSSLIRDYGLCKSTNDALLVIEAYRTLRDRGPYPADQVVKDLDGTFAFVLYDNKAGTIFAALSSDGGVPLFWGLAADGSVVISDELLVIKGSCGKSYAPFPAGCMFHSEGGLRSFEHPMNKMKAMPRVDSEGMMCGANFRVDKYTRINSMPRVGSSADWTMWDESCL